MPFFPPNPGFALDLSCLLVVAPRSKFNGTCLSSYNKASPSAELSIGKERGLPGAQSDDC